MLPVHKIYNEFPCVEIEVAGLILIPLINIHNKVLYYTVSSLFLKDKLLQFSYHRRTCKLNIKKYYVYSNMGISMHEIVMGGKADVGHTIDHMNGDGLDNTEQNLHFVTFGFNVQNKQKKSNTTSKYIGVYKDNQKWRSSITLNYKTKNLGNFDNEMDAAKMYDRYAIHYYKNQEPRTNGLLTSLEIADIHNNGIPVEYNKIARTLPKNIFFNKYRII